MSVIGTKFLPFKHYEGGFVIHNVPYLVHDRPPRIEGTSRLSMSQEHIDRLYWLMEIHIPSSGVTEFDFFDDWSEEIDKQYQKHKEEENSETDPEN
ncbi:hypothetical protein 010DV004_263 [Bacillus phage 010DV004]|nr:hypothetical protein 010DV004_263 [Bacillus phage 010DV004]QZA69475.1 hypothetical protein 010DV005_263 [Bacillus phage 010DV005]